MSSVLEYTYDEIQPLDEKEAVEKYTSEKSNYPDALIVIDGLDCGNHWTVKTYKTDREKETLLRKTVEKMLEKFARWNS